MDVNATISKGAVSRVMVVFAQTRVIVKPATKFYIRRSPDQSIALIIARPTIIQKDNFYIFPVNLGSARLCEISSRLLMALNR
jgi:hypothetical protein